jgi:UDPglucose 6-dehydrogenase
MKEGLARKYKIVDTVREVVKDSEIVFLAAQTPSLPDHSFDTTYVVKALNEVGKELSQCDDFKVVSVISTILPTTTRNILFPTLEKASGKKVGTDIGLCYNASFIAMGTTIEDFYYPEFTLIGQSDNKSGDILEKFYKTIVPQGTPILRMTWENAEIVKMAYNTFIGFKIVYANTLMEMCERLPHTDVDVISDALSKANKRVVGAKYLRGGLGDGGECHPRDNLALSWMGKKMGLSANPFAFVMDARERQTEWIAELVASYNMPIIILGMTYKPNTNLISYSPSLLVADKLKAKGFEPLLYDPIVNPIKLTDSPHCYLIGNMWDHFQDFIFPDGSVVVDPWRFLDPKKIPPAVKYHGIGKNP